MPVPDKLTIARVTTRRHGQALRSPRIGSALDTSETSPENPRDENQFGPVNHSSGVVDGQLLLLEFDSSPRRFA